MPSKSYVSKRFHYSERITIDRTPGLVDFTVITREEKLGDAKRFKYVESVAIPNDLVNRVIEALGGKP